MINRSLITATNTMTQLQKQLDNISNNLANIDTVGFKRRETNFQELLFQQFNNQPIDRNEVGRYTPNGVRQGVGAKVSHTSLQLAQGSIKTTERALDVALLKENQFFQVEVDGQTRYTRDGSFSLSVLPSGDVQLVTSEGYPVSGENGPIIFEEGYNNLIIDQNGQFNVQYPNGTSEVFNLSVVQINRPQLLQSAGNNVYSLPNLADINVLEADVFAAIGRNDIAMQQGALEQSNVEMQKEMTELINTQRSYQFNAKSISIADQMLGLINGIR